MAALVDGGLPARVWAKVAVTPGCWEWTGAKQGRGYGRVTASGRIGYAHRVIYEVLVGPIPEGTHIDHLCRNPSCVNPEHLEPVTQAENNRRAAAVKTHCPSGHPYDEANTTYRSLTGWRGCRQCSRERERARRAAA